MPITSGLARGLRSIVWKVLPAMPKANPTNSAATTRGRRYSQMERSVLSGASPPIRTRQTSAGEYTVLPTDIMTTISAHARAARPTVTVHQRLRSACNTDLSAAISQVDGFFHDVTAEAGCIGAGTITGAPAPDPTTAAEMRCVGVSAPGPTAARSLMDASIA